VRTIPLSKVYVKDLKRGEVYTFNYWLHMGPGLVQYIGPYQKEYTSGKTWKAHRFLWVKKPNGYAKGESVVTLYGDNVRGTLGWHNEKG
jgi:hypothetical protein